MTDTFPSDKSNILQSFSERSEKTDLVDGLRFILWTFLRWLFICLPIGLILGSATAIAFWYIYEPTFKATSWIKIDSSRDTLAFTDLAKEESKLFADTQIQLMRSPLAYRTRNRKVSRALRAICHRSRGKQCRLYLRRHQRHRRCLHELPRTARLGRIATDTRIT